MFKSLQLRFSLLTLFLLLTISAVGVSHWRANRRLTMATSELTAAEKMIKEQQVEIRELSHRLGILTEEDMPFVQVQSDGPFPSAQSGEPWEIEWRLHLPPNSKWKVCCATRKIPDFGLPQEAAFEQALSELHPLWNRVHISFRKDRLLGWIAEISIAGKTWVCDIYEEDAGWLSSEWDGERAGGFFDFSGENFVTQFPPDQAVTMLRLRALDIENEQEKNDANPCPGFMVWLEPVDE